MTGPRTYGGRTLMDLNKILTDRAPGLTDATTRNLIWENIMKQRNGEEL